MALTAIWLAGRAAFAAFDQLPLVLVAVVELAFLPGILVLVAPPTLRERNRNMPMLAIVAVAWLADATSLVAIARGDAALGSLALHAALNVILLLLTIVGGRIVPAFTSNALRRGDQSFSIHTYPWLERILPGAMVLNLLVDLWQPALAVPAGLLAAVTMPSVILNLAVAPASRVFSLTRRAGLRYVFSVLHALGSAAVIAWAHLTDASLIAASAALSAAITVSYVAYFVAGLSAARHPVGPLAGTA